MCSKGPRRRAGSSRSHDPGTPRSVHTWRLLLTVMLCPRNFHTPTREVPEVKYVSGTENALVPGAKLSTGTASPVTENIELSSV